MFPRWLLGTDRLRRRRRQDGGSDNAGGSGTGVGIAVNGTVARGAAISNATIRLSCANGAELTGASAADGTFTTNRAAVVYPCIGTATAGNLTYRGVLFTNSTANFTPLTDLLVQTVLAASVSGTASLTLQEFITKIRTDSTFAANVSTTTIVARFRTTVLNVIKSQLIASGKTEAEASAILAAAGNFEGQSFIIGSDLDKVLDNLATTIQNSDGSLRSVILALIKAAGDLLAPPASGGGTGGTAARAAPAVPAARAAERHAATRRAADSPRAAFRGCPFHLSFVPCLILVKPVCSGSRRRLAHCWCGRASSAVTASAFAQQSVPSSTQVAPTLDASGASGLAVTPTAPLLPWGSLGIAYDSQVVGGPVNRVYGTERAQPRGRLRSAAESRDLRPHRGQHAQHQLLYRELRASAISRSTSRPARRWTATTAGMSPPAPPTWAGRPATSARSTACSRTARSHRSTCPPAWRDAAVPPMSARRWTAPSPAPPIARCRGCRRMSNMPTARPGPVPASMRPADWLPAGWQAHIGANVRVHGDDRVNFPGGDTQGSARGWVSVGLNIPLFKVPTPAPRASTMASRMAPNDGAPMAATSPAPRMAFSTQGLPASDTPLVADMTPPVVVAKAPPSARVNLAPAGIGISSEAQAAADAIAIRRVKHAAAAPSPIAFLPDALRESLGDEIPGGPRLRYVEEPEPRGTAGAIKFAEDLLDDRFFALNGDSLTDLDLTKLRERHESSGARGTLGLYPVDDPSAFGLVRRREDGEIVEFLEKPDPAEIDTDEVSAGCYMLEKEVLDLVPADQDVSIERQVFPKLVGNGLYSQRLEGYWVDIGTPERYLEACWDILERRVQTEPGKLVDGDGVYVDADAEVAAGVTINGPAFIEAGVSIAADAQVGTRAVIGRDGRLAERARVEGSALHAGCTIGAGARVIGAILSAGVTVEDGASVPAGSVIGEGATITASAALGAGAKVGPGETA